MWQPTQDCEFNTTRCRTVRWQTAQRLSYSAATRLSALCGSWHVTQDRAPALFRKQALRLRYVGWCRAFQEFDQSYSSPDSGGLRCQLPQKIFSWDALISF